MKHIRITPQPGGGLSILCKKDTLSRWEHIATETSKEKALEKLHERLKQEELEQPVLPAL